MRSFLLCILLFIAFFLRFFSLDTIPATIGIKEITLGNAARSLSLNDPTIQAFGIGPLTIRTTHLLLSFIPFSITNLRLLSAILSVISIGIFFLLLKKITTSEKFYAILPLLATTLFIVNPWHIAISRTDIGINLGITLLLCSLYLFINFQKHKFSLFITSVFPILAMYADYAFFFPALVYMGVLIWKILHSSQQKRGIVIVQSILLGFCILPVAATSLTYATHQDADTTYWKIVNEKRAEQRISYSGNTVIAKVLHNQHVENSKLYLAQILKYTDPRAIFFTWTHSRNILPSDTGVLYPVELVFLLVGLVFMALKHHHFFRYAIVWLAVCIVPVALTRHTPDLSRTAMIIPLLMTISSMGAIICYPKLRNTFFGFPLLVLFIGVFIVRFFYMYTVIFPILERDTTVDYTQAFQYVMKLENPPPHTVITDETYGKNLSQYWEFNTKYPSPQATFPEKPPVDYELDTLYIQQCQKIATNAAMLFTSDALEKKQQVCVFTVL